ncbi:alpha/beta hydrolase [Streptomyces sp. NPDC003388]
MRVARGTLSNCGSGGARLERRRRGSRPGGWRHRRAGHPYPDARHTARPLGDGLGLLLTAQEEGHGTYPRNRCVAEKVDHCLSTGRTPAPGTVCQGQHVLRLVRSVGRLREPHLRPHDLRRGPDGTPRAPMGRASGTGRVGSTRPAGRRREGAGTFRYR